MIHLDRRLQFNSKRTVLVCCSLGEVSESYLHFRLRQISVLHHFSPCFLQVTEIVALARQLHMYHVFESQGGPP